MKKLFNYKTDSKFVISDINLILHEKTASKERKTKKNTRKRFGLHFIIINIQIKSDKYGGNENFKILYVKKSDSTL